MFQDIHVHVCIYISSTYRREPSLLPIKRGGASLCIFNPPSQLGIQVSYVLCVGMYIYCVWGEGVGGCLCYWIGFLSSFFSALSIRSLLVCYAHTCTFMYIPSTHRQDQLFQVARPLMWCQQAQPGQYNSVL